MNRLGITMVLSLAAMLPACAATGVQATVATAGETSTRAASVHEGRSAQLAADALRCMLGRLDEARCATIANVAGISPAALVRADACAIEQLGERVGRVAREELMSPMARGALLRWFDLGAGAVRESRIARTGMLCTQAEACRTRMRGNPSVDQVEAAWRIDVRGVQAHAAFDALVASSIDADEFAPEVQATALAVFADRIDATVGARPEVVGEAVATLASMQATLDGGTVPQSSTHTGPGRTDPSSAHGAGEAPGAAIEHARSALRRFLADLTASGAAHALAESARPADEAPVTTPAPR